LPPLEPGESATVDAALRGPIPPGRYRLAFDLVAEHRAWFSELGNDVAARDVAVGPRDGEAHAALPAWVEPDATWQERVNAAHRDGYAVVAGAVVWEGGLLHRRPGALDPYGPGGGRNPAFAYPLVCPSIVVGQVVSWTEPVAGLPAVERPPDPWVYDARIRMRVDAASLKA
jgi:hypothetical protein